ncbi:MAG: hypothetical protein GXP44_00400 [bacterium]|nr:hypothetical protein [bacterium]
MVQRILRLFHYEFGGLHRAAVLLAMSAILSSFLGLIRDRLLAGTFGAGRSLDIYYASFRVPDILYNLVALSLVSVTVLIPLFLEKVKDSKRDARVFLNGVLTVFLGVMIFLALMFFIFAPALAKIIAPGFSAQDIARLVVLTRIMLLSSILLGLSNLLSTVIQSYRRFFIYALSPLFYNAGIIFGIIFLYPVFGMKGLAFGVVLGAFLHAFIQVPGLIKLGYAPRLSFNISFADIKKVLLFSLPRSIGLGTQQIVLIFITAIASALSAGSIAVFHFSLNLQSVALNVVGVSYSVAAFPTLAKLFVNNQKKEFLKHTVSAARQIIFWSVPASVFFIVLRAQIVRTILGTGFFSWSDTRLVAAGVALFSVSITAQALVVLFVRAFYAAGKTKKPLVVNLFSSVCIIALSFLLVRVLSLSAPAGEFFEKIMRVEGIGGTEMLALPLAFSLGMIFNAMVLIRSFSKFVDFPILKSVRIMFIQVLGASLLMGAVSFFFLRVLDNLFDIHTTIGVFLQGFVAGVFGIMVWYASLRSAGNGELKEITDSLKQKFWKTPVIAPEPNEL